MSYPKMTEIALHEDLRPGSLLLGVMPVFLLGDHTRLACWARRLAESPNVGALTGVLGVFGAEYSPSAGRVCSPPRPARWGS